LFNGLINEHTHPKETSSAAALKQSKGRKDNWY